jgi:hypothetical protein
MNEELRAFRRYTARSPFATIGALNSCDHRRSRCGRAGCSCGRRPIRAGTIGAKLTVPRLKTTVPSFWSVPCEGSARVGVLAISPPFCASADFGRASLRPDAASAPPAATTPARTSREPRVKPFPFSSLGAGLRHAPLVRDGPKVGGRLRRLFGTTEYRATGRAGRSASRPAKCRRTHRRSGTGPGRDACLRRSSRAASRCR